MWPYFVPRLRHYEGLAPYGVPHATGAKDGKEDWLLEIRIGNRANDAGRVSGGDRVGGDIFCDDGASANDNAVTQGDSFEDDGSGTNKTATADFYRFRVFGVFGKPRKSWAESVKIVVQNHRASSKNCVFTDFNRVSGDNYTTTNSNPISKYKASGGAHCAENTRGGAT